MLEGKIVEIMREAKLEMADMWDTFSTSEQKDITVQVDRSLNAHAIRVLASHAEVSDIGSDGEGGLLIRFVAT